MITIVGAPIGLIGFGLYFSVLYLSQVFLGLAIGRLILPSRWDTTSRGYNLLAMVIGVLILGGIRLIPVPYLGGRCRILDRIVRTRGVRGCAAREPAISPNAELLSVDREKSGDGRNRPSPDGYCLRSCDYSSSAAEVLGGWPVRPAPRRPGGH